MLKIMLDKCFICLHTASMITASIQLGSRIYLRNAICGEPGCVMGFDRQGRALVDWSADMPEINRLTSHSTEDLVIDEAFTITQLDLSFDDVAA